MAEKKPSKAIQKQLGEYGNTDCEIDETTSWPDGLNETSRFFPNLSRPLKRTDSLDDIERYKLYFSLARKNQRNQLTWKNYCDILLDDLRTSDIVHALGKISIQPSCTSGSSKASNFPTGIRSVSSLKKVFENRTPKNKRSFADIDADVESLSSADDVKFRPTSRNAVKLPIQPSCTPVKQESNFSQTARSVASLKKSYENYTPIKRSFVDTDGDFESALSQDDANFLTPSKNVLKKMCTEIRTLAQKTCKTVERMTTSTKYCSACGDVIRSTTVHKKCSKQRIEKNNYHTPATSGIFRLSNPVKKRPMIFQSPTITTSNARIKKLECKPFCRI